MLPRNQDFERAVAEFDRVFSRIPLHVCASQNDGRMHVPSSGGRAVLEQLARDAGSKQLQLRAIIKQWPQRPKPENSVQVRLHA